MKKRWIQAAGVLVFLLLCIAFMIWQQAEQKRQIQELERRGTYYELTVLSPVNGELKYVGEPAAWAVSYAQEKINAAGGINGIPVRIHVEDTEFQAEKAMLAAKGLVKDQRIFLGPVDSPGTEAVAGIVEENRIPNVGTYVYEEIRKRMAPYGICYLEDSIEGEKDAVRYWKERNPDFRRIVILALATDNVQIESAKVLEQYIPTIGLEVLDTIFIDMETEGGMYAVVQALNAKADGYFLLARAEEYGVLLTEFRKRGVTEGRRILASFSCFENDMIETHGDVLGDTYIWNSVNLDYEGEEWQALVEDYQRAHGGKSPDNSVVVDMYNTVFAWKQCIEELNLQPIPQDLKKERQMIGQWFYNSPVLEGIQGEYQWIEGKKVEEICLFQFDREGNAIAITP